jgi:hypothetical protein
MGDVDLACGGVEPAPGVSDLARRTADLPEQLGEEATTTEPAMAAATPQPPHKPKIHWGGSGSGLKEFHPCSPSR